MNMTVTIPIVLSQLLLQATTSRFCKPDTTFSVNGQLCVCDSTGRWTDANCRGVGRRSACQSGHITWQGCRRCICQENGQQVCTNVGCLGDDSKATTVNDPYLGTNVNSIGVWCTPFHSYFVNCKVCVCPVSGRSVDAHCVHDSTCTLGGEHTVESLISENKVCLPKVIYLFSCLQCLCADHGRFVKEKCVQKCQKTKIQAIGDPSKHCTPHTLFKHGYNICFCPDGGQMNELLCSTTYSTRSTEYKNLYELQKIPSKCTPHSFTNTICIYCECLPQGLINANLCREYPCLQISEKDYVSSGMCKAGEIVPICYECFCLSSGTTNATFCSNTCSYQSRLTTLENTLKLNQMNKDLINIDAIPRLMDNKRCVVNTIYMDQERFCLCPENSHTYFKICTSVAESTLPPDFRTPRNKLKILAADSICEPNTFVNNECNTCYCTTSGKIDPKWCTYDDCDIKREVLEHHKKTTSNTRTTKDTCTPGAMFKQACNFCICSDSGLIANSSCTNSRCSLDTSSFPNPFACEPLTYYDIDCNVCLCPRDGIKNLNQCTKNPCEKSFLNNNDCAAGSLFSDDCNLCVCPPTGNKDDKTCTKDVCHDPTAETWQSIFKHSHVMISRNHAEDTQRFIDICFPGEQFIIGCQLCACPEMGLRTYATCQQLLCEEKLIKDAWSSSEMIGENRGDTPNFAFRDSFSDTNFFVNGRRLMDPGNSTFVKTLYSCETPGKIMDKCFMCNCEEKSKTITVDHCLKSDNSDCEYATPTFLNETQKL